MKYGFVKVAAAVPAVRVADVDYNVQEIERLMALAESEHVELLCFPELTLTGYTCQDLFTQQLLIEEAEQVKPKKKKRTGDGRNFGDVVKDFLAKTFTEEGVDE